MIGIPIENWSYNTENFVWEMFCDVVHANVYIDCKGNYVLHNLKNAFLVAEVISMKYEFRLGLSESTGHLQKLQLARSSDIPTCVP